MFLSTFFHLFTRTGMPTWDSIIVCSNLGPVIASSLGIWLRDQGLALLGACNCLALSPSVTISCNGASEAPMESTGVSSVFDTLGVSFRDWGSLAC